jgi:ABC-2 type transport system ATP-binding protein
MGFYRLNDPIALGQPYNLSVSQPDSSASVSPADDLAISTRNLRKEYRTRSGRFVAVDDLTLDVPRGQIFGFLGPNGAGKTTTINMLLGNIAASGGYGNLLGAPLGNLAARRRLGFLPEKFQFHEFLTAEEFLDLHGRLYGMSRQARRRAADDALDRVGLADRRSSRIREFSKGMQQRVGLAQAIMNKPSLVVLDEPTSALDPLGRRDVRNLLASLKAEGVTIFLNSHLLSEIEMTCDRVAIVKSGRVIRQGSIDELLSAKSIVELRVRGLTDPIRRELQALATAPIAVEGESIAVTVAGDDVIADLATAVVRGGARLLALIPSRESLEDLFIRTVEDETAPE